MGFLQRLGFQGDPPLIGKKALTGTPAVLEALNQRNWSPYTPLGGTNLRVERINSVYVATQNASYGWIYKTSPAVRTVIDYIAQNIAQLGIKVYKRIADDEREHMGDHPAAEALRWPNSWTPGNQFLKEFVTDFLIYDNAYALKFPGPGGLSLVNVPAHMVGLIGSSFFAVDGYRVFNQNGETFDFPPERMIHWRGKNPDDPRRGESKLETLREEIAADAAARQANVELHRSGLTMPGWVERPAEAPNWTNEAMGRWRESFAAQVKKATREVPVLEEGMVYKTGGVTPEDAELLAARNVHYERVAQIYGMKNVPPASDEERTQFYSDVLPPMTELLASVFDLHILIREYHQEDHYFEFGREKLMDEIYKTLTSASGRPILTTNEARARIDEHAIEGGDDLVTPANVIVGDNPLPSVGVMPIQSPNRPSQDGDARSDDAPTPMPARRASLNGHAVESKAMLVNRWEARRRRRRRYAKDFVSGVTGHYSHVRRSLKSNGDVKAIEDQRWVTGLEKKLLPIAQRSVAEEGGIEAARLGMPDFDSSRAENWLVEMVAGMSKGLMGAIQKAAKDTDLDQAFEQARRDAPDHAFSLATKVTNFAALEAGRQTPDAEFRTKRWIVSSDNSEHPEMDGEAVPLAAVFSNGADHPPYEHIGCQCFLEIDAGGHAPVKAIEPETKQQPIEIHNHYHVEQGAVQFGEGMVKSHTTVEPTQITNNVEQPDVKVYAPTTIEKGAVESHTNVEAPPPADVRTVFDKGAIQNTTNVEAPPPADVRTVFDEGSIQANVKAGDVNVEPQKPADIHLTVESPEKTTKKVIRDDKGHISEIVEERKQNVNRDPDTGRIESVEEE